MLIHVNSNRCLEMDGKDSKLFVSRCLKGNLNQQWYLENLDEDALAKWNTL